MTQIKLEVTWGEGERLMTLRELDDDGDMSISLEHNEDFVETWINKEDAQEIVNFLLEQFKL